MWWSRLPMRHAVRRRVGRMHIHVSGLRRLNAFRRRRRRVWELRLHGRRRRSLVRLVVGIRPRRQRRRLPGAIVLVVLVLLPAVSRVMKLLRRWNGRQAVLRFRRARRRVVVLLYGRELGGLGWVTSVRRVLLMRRRRTVLLRRRGRRRRLWVLLVVGRSRIAGDRRRISRLRHSEPCVSRLGTLTMGSQTDYLSGKEMLYAAGGGTGSKD